MHGPRSPLRATLLLASLLGLAIGCGVIGCGAAASATKPGSIGAVLSRDSHTGIVHVHEVPPGLAGAEAGLEPGDRLKMIDGVHVDDLDGEEIRGLLRGPVGTKVTLTLIRGERVLDLEVSRTQLGEAPEPKPRHERIE